MRVLTLLVLAVLLASPAGADLIAWDSLNAALTTYPAPLHGYNSGTNLGAWVVQNQNPLQVVGNGLAYPHLLADGYGAVLGGGYTSAGRPVPVGASAWAPYVKSIGGTSVVGADGTALWFSALVTQNTARNSFQLGLHASSTAWASDSNMVSLGLTSGGEWQLAQSGGQSVSTGVARVPGQTYLVTMKMEFLDSASDRITLYINPTPGLSEPDVPGVSITTKSDWGFRSMRFFADNNAYSGAVDELRFGTTYNSVAPRTEDTGGGSNLMRTFFTGNSSTDDVGFEGLRLMAAKNGQTFNYARHVIPGSPLDNIWNNPTQGLTTDPYGHYPEALSNYTWDAVSLQTHDSQIEKDVEICGNFINLTWENSPDARIMIFGRWMRRDEDLSLDYEQEYLRPYDRSFRSWQTKEYFELLVQELRALYPDKADQIILTPVGEVFYRLDQKMKAGEVPGFTDISELYTDRIHLTGAGRFVAGTTFHATLYMADPTGLDPSSYSSNIDPEFAAIVQGIVWDVVSTHELVPEPASLALLGLGSLGLLRRRTR